MDRTNKFLIVGHILDERRIRRTVWYRLHEQCFVINFKMVKLDIKVDYHNGSIPVHGGSS